jgi:TolA-binding protein
VAFQRQDLPLAAERFGRLLQQDPDGPLAAEAAMMQATCWDKLGRAEPALAAYLAVATRHEDSHYAAMAWFQAARLQEQAGQPEEALQSLHRVLERHPTFPHRDAALYQTATLLVKLDRAHEADDLFRQLSDDHRDSRYWAEATYRLAERSAAAEQYTRAAQLIEQILAAKGEPEVLGHAAYLKGQLAAHDGRWDEAILAFQRVVTLLTDPHWRAAAWLQEAKAHVAKHDPEAARRLLTLLLAEYPRSPFAQEARQYLERANVERPNSGKSEMATTSLDASE